MKTKKNSAIDAKIEVVLWNKKNNAALKGLSKDLSAFIQEETKAGKDRVVQQNAGKSQYYFIVDNEDKTARTLEKWRTAGNDIQAAANAIKADSVVVKSEGVDEEITYAFAEGMALGNYKFTKYFKDAKSKQPALKQLFIQDTHLSESKQRELFTLVNATHLSRTLVNEPVSYLTAEKFSEEMVKAGKEAGFTVKVLHKKQIEALKMGGLLGVNKGSIDPPTFTIMEYKPAKAKNKKPLVLVGKGVVFDTGGLSLKPTPGSMDEMKCDMGGAAAVVGAMFAVAANKLPVHVIGLVPATDNRPGMNAICPQDVLTISDGTTIEVMNTDAEGRLILADALVYAQKYNPDLVIDLATLTGAAIRAIGTYASATMGTASGEVMKNLEEAGNEVWERTIQFPLWSEFGDELKSDVADMKNLGGGNGGHMSAGKFLEHFTQYPWIHIDIAGTAWNGAAQSYRTKGGTGVGVRMLYRFIQKQYLKSKV
jgi:leucyl aminopeptidase